MKTGCKTSLLLGAALFVATSCELADETPQIDSDQQQLGGVAEFSFSELFPGRTAPLTLSGKVVAAPTPQACGGPAGMIDGAVLTQLNNNSAAMSLFFDPSPADWALATNNGPAGGPNGPMTLLNLQSWTMTGDGSPKPIAANKAVTLALTMSYGGQAVNLTQSGTISNVTDAPRSFTVQMKTGFFVTSEFVFSMTGPNSFNNTFKMTSLGALGALALNLRTACGEAADKSVSKQFFYEMPPLPPQALPPQAPLPLPPIVPLPALPEKCWPNPPGNLVAFDSSGVSCNDGNDCTLDDCSPPTGCVHINLNSGSCNGGNGKCSAGACVALFCSTPCNDGNECTADSCSNQFDICTFQLLTGPTCAAGMGVCQNGACVSNTMPGTPPGTGGGIPGYPPGPGTGIPGYPPGPGTGMPGTPPGAGIGMPGYPPGGTGMAPLPPLPPPQPMEPAPPFIPPPAPQKDRMPLPAYPNDPTFGGYTPAPVYPPAGYGPPYYYFF